MKKIALTVLVGVFAVFSIYSASVVHFIDQKKCVNCGVCVDACPEAAIETVVKDKKTIYVINDKTCTQCGTCVEECPEGAILTKESGK